MGVGSAGPSVGSQVSASALAITYSQMFLNSIFLFFFEFVLWKLRTPTCGLYNLNEALDDMVEGAGT